MAKGVYTRQSRWTCRHCGYGSGSDHWQGYVCICGQVNEPLYRAEHLRPKVGARLSSADIVAEFRAAGYPIAPVHLSKARLSQLRGSTLI